MKLSEQLDAAPERSSYSHLVREYLIDRWKQVEEALPGAALGLVGSFGRDVGGPRSDLDVVVLLPGPISRLDDGEEAITQFVQGLWDSGLGVDHSVRTPAQAAEIAGADLPALTGLLHLTHVAGNEELSRTTVSRILDEYRKAARRRAGDLLADAERRWKRFDRLDRLNEPDLKYSEGGLRDVDFLLALSTSWLTDFDRPAVAQSETIILDVRDALHRVTGRQATRLMRAYQEDVSKMAGYASETRMMRALRDASEIISDQVREAAVAAKASQKSWGPMGLSLRRKRPRVDPDWVSDSLQVTEGTLCFRRPADAHDPDRVFEIACWGATHRIPISPATLADMAETIGMPFEWTPQRVDSLIDLLGAGPGLRDTWEQLDRVGIPVWWIPQWAGLRGRPQSADFHQWTVDRHLIETVIRAQAIIAGTEAEWDGRPIPYPDTLLLTALLHDLGKQPPHGGVHHAAHGAALAAPLLDEMGIAQKADVIALIENHLLLATLSTEADPEDPLTSETLVNAVSGRRDMVVMLEALTFADSLGAGPKAWSPWRAALMRQLMSQVQLQWG